MSELIVSVLTVISIIFAFVIAPNVTMSTTNHPMHFKARSCGETYCKKVVIEDDDLKEFEPIPE